jgi:two-component system sensor histidine kinase RegB
MAVIVKDMQQDGKVTEEKLGILRGQIDRCKEILGSLTAAAGQVRAEGGKARRLDEYLDEILAKWRLVRPAVSLTHRFEGTRPAPRILAEQTLYQAILNILNNAADASPREVEVLGRWTEDYLTLEVCDRGPGLPAAVERSARQPFFTTKEEGLGLGLFLAYAAVERLGGEVALFNRAGGGACCRLILPLMPLRVIDDEG